MANGRFIERGFIGFLGLVVALAACSLNEETVGGERPGSGGATATIDVGAAGGSKTLATTATTVRGSGGAASTIAGGSGGIKGISAGGSAAGGSADAGATGGTPVTSSGRCDATAFACRGADPTMATAIGTAKGPYVINTMTSGYRDGPKFADATIHYPTNADPPFGCVAIVPGFVAPQSSIQAWGPFLASHGIVTMTIGTNAPGEDPKARAEALLDALVSCVAENERPDSPLSGKIQKDRTGIAGWSMGGGGTLIAASTHPEIKAAVSFAAWLPTGGKTNQVPALMFEATADGLAANMSDPYYKDVPETTPKMLFEVQGAPHEVANDPANSAGVIGLYGLSWFKVFLEGDTRYRQFLTAGKPSIATAKFATNVR